MEAGSVGRTVLNLVVETKVNNNHLHKMDDGYSLEHVAEGWQQVNEKITLLFSYGYADKWSMFDSMNHKLQR